MSTKLAPILDLNRDQNPFVPQEFLGQGFGFWYGPSNGLGLEGDGDMEADYRSLQLTQVNLSEIHLRSYLEQSEKRVPGEEIIRRATETYSLRLDLGIFQILWNTQYLLRQLFRDNFAASIFFDGQTIRSPAGRRCTLGVYLKDGLPQWGLRRLGRLRTANDLSAVLPTIRTL